MPTPELSHRLKILFHELFTGQRPFRGIEIDSCEDALSRRMLRLLRQARTSTPPVPYRAILQALMVDGSPGLLHTVYRQAIKEGFYKEADKA